jgi:WD40 repeat protein
MGGRGGRGEDVNWEDPSPPFVISLSSDGTVKAWDVMQGKAVWSLEGEDISCLAARDSRGEVALGRPDGRVQLWGVGEWTLRSTFHTSGGGCGAVLQYGSVGTKRESGGLPQIFLMVHTQNGQLELWDPEAVLTSPDKQATDPVKPVLQLWAPSHVTHCRLSSYGLLCLVAGFGEVYVCDGISHTYS